MASVIANAASARTAREANNAFGPKPGGFPNRSTPQGPFVQGGSRAQQPIPSRKERYEKSVEHFRPRPIPNNRVGGRQAPNGSERLA